MGPQNNQLPWGQINRFPGGPGGPQMNPGQNQLYPNQPGIFFEMTQILGYKFESQFFFQNYKSI